MSYRISVRVSSEEDGGRSQTIRKGFKRKPTGPQIAAMTFEAFAPFGGVARTPRKPKS